MFGALPVLSLALAAFSAVSARVVPRANPPAGWDTGYLEPYNNYHCRYLAVGCDTQHGTSFFNQCCHPLLATESSSSLPSQCQLPSDVTCSNGEPVTSTDDGDCTEEPSSTPSQPAPTTTSAPVNVAPVPSVTPSPTFTPTPTPTFTPTSTANTQPPASPTSGSGSSNLVSGGVATFFYQNGQAGACGNVNPDSALIAAIDQDRYGNSGDVSELCGQQVKITNTQNGKTVTVTIADDCPTCDNSNSIDLSVGAFEEIADLNTGEVSIVWEFVN